MIRVYEPFHGGRTGVALLLIRGIIGLAFAFHGWPKLQDPAAFAGMMHLPLFLGWVVAVVEFFGGILLLLGLLSPLAALLLACDMLGALLIVHFPHHDPFVKPGAESFEPAVVYLLVMVGLLLAGPGIYSLDGLLLQRLRERGAAVPAPTRQRGTA